jgi:hypothetical protein
MSSGDCTLKNCDSNYFPYSSKLVFVTVSFFLGSLIFAEKAGLEHILTGLHSEGKPKPLPD